MKAPNIWRLEDLFYCTRKCQANINGEWVPSRPIGLFTIQNRLKAAWLVFTGKADVVKWPKGQ